MDLLAAGVLKAANNNEHYFQEYNRAEYTPKNEPDKRFSLERQATKSSLLVDLDWIEEEEIGRGAFGRVVLGHQTKTGKKMAVKIVPVSSDPKRLQDAEREIEVLADLGSQEFIVELIGYQIKDSQLYIFMEYVEGGSIDSQLQKFEPSKEGFGEALVAKYTYQILRGLIVLHDKKIFHGDIKCMPG